MAADFRLVAHAAQRQAHELAAGGLGDRTAERGLADARRTHQAQDRTLQRIGPALHRQVLEDALLDLVQAVVVLVEDPLGLDDVDLPRLGLAPGDRQQPVEVVAHDGGFRRHRAHVAQLLELRIGLGAGLLGELGALDPLLELVELVAGVLLFAQLALDRLHLLVEIVLALGLLHLALHARADLLLDVQHRDLALHQGEDLLQTLGDVEDLQEVLAIGDLDRQVLGDLVGQLGRIGDLRDAGHGIGLDLLVELHVVVELLDHRARQRLGLMRLAQLLVDRGDFGFVELGLVGELDDRGPRLALDQHLDRAVGQLEQLQHLGDDADVVDGAGLGIVVGGVLLGGQKDLLVSLHHLFEGAHRLVAADEKRADHVREHDNVPQRQHRNCSHLAHNAMLPDRRIPGARPRTTLPDSVGRPVHFRRIRRVGK